MILRIRTLTYFLLIAIQLTSLVEGQTFRWSERMGGTASDFARFTAIDFAGNTYTIGGFSGSVVFPGNTSSGSRTLNSLGAKDIYITKMNCSRQMVWKNQIGSANNELGNFVYLSIKYDGAGFLYTTGTISNGARFTTTSGSDSIVSSAGQYDAFLAKYDTTGKLIWVVTAGGTLNDEGTDVCIDHSGNIIWSGYYQGTSTFKTIGGTTITKTSDGSNDIFVAKYSPDGKLKMVSTALGSALDLVTSVSVDKQNNIYASVCSFGTSTIDFGPFTLTNLGHWGAFVTKMDSTGLWLWGNGMGTSIEESIGRACVDDSNHVFAIVHYQGGNSSFSSSAPGSPVSLVNNGSYDIVLISLDENGVIRWGRSVGGTGVEYGWHVCMGVDGSVIFSGNYGTTCDFGNGYILNSAGNKDGFVAYLNPTTGTTRGVVTLGGPGDDEVQSVVADHNGAVYLCGYFNNACIFGTQTHTSVGSDESFVAKLEPYLDFPITASPYYALCPGDTTYLFPVSPQFNSGYQWLKAGVAILGEINDTLMVTDTGTYRLVYLNECNESDTSQPLTISSYQLQIAAGPDRAVCTGDSVHLNATGASTYAWKPGIYLNDTTIGNPWCKPLQDTTYIVSASFRGCYDADTIKVSVSIPTVAAGLDKQLCKGDSVQLAASGAVIYRWDHGSLLSDSTISNPWAKPTDTTLFIVTGWSGTCKAYDTLIVYVIHTLCSAGIDQTICPGDSIQLAGNGSGIIQWSPSTGLSNPVVLNPFAKPTTRTAYILKVTDNGCSVQDTVNVTVASTGSLNAGSDVSICRGDSTQLHATGLAISYWAPGATLTDSLNNDPIAFPMNTTDYAAYSVVAGCTIGDTVRVVVNDLPVVDAGADITLCIDQSRQIAAVVTGADQYSWSPLGGLSDSTILNPLVSGRTQMQYVLTATQSTSGCHTSDTMLYFPDSVVALFSATPVNGTVPLVVQFTNLSTNANSYQWDFDSSGFSVSVTNPAHTYTLPGTWLARLAATSASGCLDTFELHIEAQTGQIVYIPNVFTPNGDLVNDSFIVSLLNAGLLKLMKGSIWNRWGAKIYEWEMPGGKWWDGKFEGQFCQNDVYVYLIEITDTKDRIKTYSGTVTLLR